MTSHPTLETAGCSFSVAITDCMDAPLPKSGAVAAQRRATKLRAEIYDDKGGPLLCGDDLPNDQTAWRSKGAKARICGSSKRRRKPVVWAERGIAMAIEICKTMSA